MKKGQAGPWGPAADEAPAPPKKINTGRNACATRIEERLATSDQVLEAKVMRLPAGSFTVISVVP